MDTLFLFVCSAICKVWYGQTPVEVHACCSFSAGKTLLNKPGHAGSGLNLWWRQQFMEMRHWYLASRAQQEQRCALAHQLHTAMLDADQLLHVPTKNLVFPLGSPLRPEAAHQEGVGMDIACSIQHITLEEGKADKDR
ncbi:TPA: hypothetical protein ACH3X2_013182 [Trebouxia sp. C0005]